MSTKFNKPTPLKQFNKKVKQRRKAKEVILEKTIEKDVKTYAKERGVLARKYVSIAFPSVPDGIFFFDNGVSILIEFKRPGNQLSLKQAKEIYRLVKRGHLVYVINNTATGMAIIEWYVQRAKTAKHIAPVHVPTEAEWQSVTNTKERVITEE